MHLLKKMDTNEGYSVIIFCIRYVNGKWQLSNRKNDWNSEIIGKYIDLFEYTLKITETSKYFSKHNYEIIITPIIWKCTIYITL